MIKHIALGVLNNLEEDPKHLATVSINPFNVLILDNFRIKVIDLYKKDDDIEWDEVVDYEQAVKMFLAPEALNKPDSKKSQVFSLGCLLYLLTKFENAGPKPEEIYPFTCLFNYKSCEPLPENSNF